eukprot:2123473-Rhodomonas_salina.2
MREEEDDRRKGLASDRQIDRPCDTHGRQRHIRVTDQLLCLPEPLTLEKGFSCKRHADAGISGTAAHQV